jgi:hypothetical protein
MQKKVAVIDMRILIDMIDTLRIKRRSAALDAMDFIALFEQKLGEVRAILARDTSNEGDFFHCAAVPAGTIYLPKLSGATSSPSGQTALPGHRQLPAKIAILLSRQ